MQYDSLKINKFAQSR